MPDRNVEHCHCVIGPGRLGSALLAALRARGQSVASVGVASADRVDAAADPPHLLTPDAVAVAMPTRDRHLAIWLTVPDDAIVPATEQVAGVLREHAGSAVVVVHTSGIGSLKLLGAVAAAGARPLALHPLQSFAAGAGADALDGVPVAVTAADSSGRDVGFALAAVIGGCPFDLPDASRGRYHLAAVVASNLLVALEAEAADLLRHATGDDVRQAVERLRPLVSTTLANVHAHGPERALTGPVARGDVGTVRGHLEILDHHAPRYAAAYRALSLEALALAAPRLDDEAVAALHELLGPFPGQAGGSAAYAVPTTPTASANQLATQQDTVDARARVRSTQDVAGMAIARTAAEMRAACAALPRPLGFVPTMGALHEGHLELVRSARRRCAAVVASVFVNPRQFGAEEDFAVYPRCETRDFDLLREEGVAVVFAPATDDVYPEGFATAVHVTGPLSESFEGAHRPGHFAGVATVVVKLLHVAQPDTVFLGEKDAQQLALLRQMVRDLDLPVAIVGVPTVREPDGLAMSSRNRRLKPDERRVAPRVHAALRAGRQAAQTKSGSPAPADVVIAAVRGGLRPASPGEPAFSIDYIDVVAPNTFERLTKANGDALIVAAARLGTVRLIDNLRVAGPRTNHEARDKSRARKNLSQRPGG